MDNLEANITNTDYDGPKTAGFVWRWKVDTAEIRQEIPTEFLNVALEKDGEGQ